MSIRIRRAYEPPARSDGYRVLVDRVWPRGVSRSALAIDEWMRELAPTAPLRKWFAHDPARWQEFQRRYTLELRKRPVVRSLLDRVRRGRITLVYGARDPDHNNAVVLRAFLEKEARRRGGDDR